MQAKQTLLKEIIREAVATTTAHAICRVAPASRDALARILWLIAFFCFLGLLVNSTVTYINRLTNPNIKSVLDAEGAEFEFPDLYFCNSLQAAGSSTYLLNQTEADQVLQPLRAVQATFDAALGAMNVSTAEAAILDKLRSLSSIQSLPYRVLADIVGQRRLFTFYRNFGIFSVGQEPTLNAPVRIETIYHPNHLKCFKVALTESELARMRNTNNRLLFNLQLDPYFLKFEYMGLYSPEAMRLPIMSWINAGQTYYIYPFDWNLENPLEIDRGSGMYLYLTPRGHYPSRYTTQVVSLGPGRSYDMAVSMSDSRLTATDFPNQCVEQQEPVQFFNPYSGTADTYNYSEAFCYYSEIARVAQQQFNCSLTPQPIPWEFRNLSLCLNVSAASSMEAIQQNLHRALAAQQTGNSSSNGMDQTCSAKRLCQRRIYHVTSSYGMWPNEGSLVRLVQNLMGSLMSSIDPAELRPLVIGVSTLNRSDPHDVVGYEAGVSSYFRSCCLRVSLRAETTRSPVTTFSLDYGLSQFVADFGGAIGLYLGCSLLTLLELVELLHDMMAFGSCSCQKHDDMRTPRRRQPISQLST